MAEQMKESSVNIRRLALQALLAINRDSAYANIALQQYVQKYKFSDTNRRFFTELVYGVVRRRNYLDAVIEHFSGKKIKKLSPVVVEILRLGLYQLIYLNKVPQSAAVNESVKLAKKMTKGGIDRFVNAILRNYLRRLDEVSIKKLAKSKAQYMALTYNQPSWLMEHWLHEYGAAKTEEICRYFNEKPALTTRLNTLKGNMSELVEKIVASGWKGQRSDKIPEGFIVTEHNGNLEQAFAVQEGLLTFMDEASMAVAHVVSPQENERILDCCAAPGGKSLHMAALMKNQGEIVSCDIYEHKLELLRKSATRLGVEIIQTKLQDGRELSPEVIGLFDRVLVDAPCSGLGILQKKLDMRWHKTKESLDTLPELQFEILEKAANCVKTGGVLVYSTCTLNKKENEGVVERFLAAHKEFLMEDASSFLPFEVKGSMVTLLPSENQTDGFFMARLRKEI